MLKYSGIRLIMFNCAGQPIQYINRREKGDQNGLIARCRTLDWLPLVSIAENWFPNCRPVKCLIHWVSSHVNYETFAAGGAVTSTPK